MKKQGKKSNAQLIIGVLLTGKDLKSREISEKIAETEGRTINVQDVASMLSKISDHNKCHLGYFIEREQKGNGFVYHMVQEALAFSEKKAYDLTLKTGKDRYTLAQALEEFPGLNQYVESPKARPGVKDIPKKPAAKKAAKAVKPAKPVKKEKATVKPLSESKVAASVSEDKKVEDMAARLIQKIDELGGLNLNVKLSFQLEEAEK
ncbi:hypothetical protein [Desulfonema magnum]|nr:hypothetical protein [Desulfonema magnum]